MRSGSRPPSSINIGYELRCADPISSTWNTRGSGLLRGAIPPGGRHRGHGVDPKRALSAIPIGGHLDPADGPHACAHGRFESESYAIARRYMIRLSPEDLSQPEDVVRLATAAGLASDDFRKRFRVSDGKGCVTGLANHDTRFSPDAKELSPANLRTSARSSRPGVPPCGATSHRRPRRRNRPASGDIPEAQKKGGQGDC